MILKKQSRYKNKKLRPIKILFGLICCLIFIACIKKDVISSANYNDFDIYKLEPLTSYKQDGGYYVNVSRIGNRNVIMNFIGLKGEILKHDSIFYDNSDNPYFVNEREVYGKGLHDKFKIYTVTVSTPPTTYFSTVLLFLPLG